MTTEPAAESAAPDSAEERPQVHARGGQDAAPIAGDTTSFLSDADLARTLVADAARGTLCTLTSDGYPYGSMLSFADDPLGAPVLLMSEMAEHTINARQDGRASLLVAADVVEGADPLSAPRLTLVGQLQPLAFPGPAREVFLTKHPYARSYVNYGDFNIWRLEVERGRYIGGFGHMSWFDGSAYADASVDPIAGSTDYILSHMNDDHGDANLVYVQAFAGLTEATEAVMVGFDANGMTLQATTPEGPRLARVAFPERLQHADQAAPATIMMMRRAHEILGLLDPLEGIKERP